MKNQLCSEIGQEVQDIVLIDYIGSNLLPTDYAMPRFDDKFLGSVKQEDKKK